MHPKKQYTNTDKKFSLDWRTVVLLKTGIYVCIYIILNPNRGKKNTKNKNKIKTQLKDISSTIINIWAACFHSRLKLKSSNMKQQR